MRRSTSVTITLMVLSLAALAAAPGVSAKPPSQAGPGADHPRGKDGGRGLVGTWVVDTNAADPDNPLDLLTVSADGTLRETNCCGRSGAGTWVAIDRGTAVATILFPSTDEDGFIGFDTVRGSVELAPDGSTFTATYTIEPATREAESPGQLGPVTATGTRVAIELMGQAVGPVPTEEAPAEKSSPEPSESPAG